MNLYVRTWFSSGSSSFAQFHLKLAPRKLKKQEVLLLDLCRRCHDTSWDVFLRSSRFAAVVFSLWPSKYPGSTQTGVGVDANQHALKMTLLQLVIISLISALYSNQFHCTRHKDPQKSGRSAASRHEGSIWSNSLSKYMYKSMIELKIKKTRTHISWRQFYSVFYFYFLSLSAEAAEQQRTDHWDGVRRVKLSHSVH